jgi:hypothetical protein
MQTQHATSLPAVATLRDQGFWPQPGGKRAARLHRETGQGCTLVRRFAGEQFSKALCAFGPFGRYIYPTNLVCRALASIIGGQNL